MLRYGQDITLGDVERLDAFLTARTARLARAERGSDERQLARSVRAALLHLVVTLQHSLSFPDADIETQALTRLKIRMSWNALWALVTPWNWHDGYDQERWRSVKHWDNGQEVEFEELLADEFSKRRRGETPQSDDE